MRIGKVKLLHFRNYDELELDFPSNIIVFYGRNGQGKTNILESLYVSGLGKSYRASSDQELLMWDQPDSSVITTFTCKEVEQEIKLVLHRQGKKKIYVNDTLASQKNLVGSLNVVLFSPEDLQLVKDSPRVRRRFLDMEISQVNPVYYKTLLSYQRALMQRNLLLKQRKGQRLERMPEWDEQIAHGAATLVAKRLESLKKLNMLSHLMQRRLTDGEESLRMVYEQPYWQAGVDSEEDRTNPLWYEKKLAETWEQDRYRGTTSIGPHRDDLGFYINDWDLRKYGSQGQQRTAVLALKLSELEYMKSEAGEYPVLLLDDVMSELDTARRQGLVRFIRDRIQTFITTALVEPLTSLEDALFFKVEKGTISYDEKKAALSGKS